MTDEQAYEAICETFRSSWLSAGGSLSRVEWTNVADDDGRPPLFDGNGPWARHTVRWVDGDQRTFGEVGARRFERAGTIIVQVFAPAGKRGLDGAHPLAKAARDAYEGVTLGGVRFSRVARVDVGQDGPWYQVNVTAAFEYDEVK